jgi:phosphatidate cytidylyltransferase
MSALRDRVVTALVLAPVAIAGVLWLPTPTFALALGGVFVFGLTEWARLAGLRSSWSRTLLLVGSGAAMYAIWQWRSSDLLRYVVLLGAAWWPLAALWLRHTGFGAADRRRNHGIKAIAGALCVVPAWAGAVMLHGLPDRGPWWVMFVLVLVWCADIAAFFVGRRYGRTKLAPTISPGKTRAGVWGALAGSALFAVAGGIALGKASAALALLVALAIVTVLFSIVGDLFESLIKRHSNAKDSGAILPGHGGVFDRFDSLFAAMPVFVTGKLALGL